MVCPISSDHYKNVFGNKIRYFPLKKIRKDIHNLRNNWNAKAIYFHDDNFADKPQRVRDICKIMIEFIDSIKWRCALRVDSVQWDLLKLMKRSGCDYINFGIESGNPKILNNIKKDITIKQIKKAIYMCSKLDINTKGYFIIGLPGETETTMKKTIVFAKSLNLTKIMFTLATPFPGTLLWKLANFEESLINYEFFDNFLSYNNKINKIQIVHNFTKVSDIQLYEIIKKAKNAEIEYNNRR